MKTEFGKWLMDKAKEDEYINCCGIRFADSNWWYFVFQVPRQESRQEPDAQAGTGQHLRLTLHHNTGLRADRLKDMNRKLFIKYN